MLQPPLPEREAARLESLCSLGILDTESEERFDRITRLAALSFDVPIALVSLVDADRQWFKSRHGLDATETPRDVSFCGHAILSEEVFVVNDATADERFADNPLVVGEPYVCFYAGVPLADDDGYRLGTLCLIDHVPRELSAADEVLLRELGAMARTELMSIAREELIREHDQMLRRLEATTEAIEDGLITTDWEGTIVAANRSAETMFGYDPADLLGRPLAELLPDDWHLRLAARAERTDAAADGSIELNGKRRDGGEFRMRISTRATIHADDRLVVTVVRDMTKLREVEDSFRDSQQLHRAVFAAMHEAVMVVDPDGDPITANESARVLMEPGYTDDESVQDWQIDRLDLDGNSIPFEERPLPWTLATGEAVAGRIMGFPLESGEVTWLQVATQPMFRPDEEHLYAVVLTLADVTDRIEVDRLKSQFVSTVSHELRTPLTAIQGSLRLLTSGAVGEMPESASRMLEMAQHNTTRLVRLVNDILDLQRMESRTEKLIYGTCRDARLFDEVASLMASLADEAEVALELDPAGLSFSADGDRLLQTLSNLVGNAIKFTEPGGRITITTEQKGDEIVFSVADTGHGVPSDKLESIFGRFQQVEASDSARRAEPDSVWRSASGSSKATAAPSTPGRRSARAAPSGSPSRCTPPTPRWSSSRSTPRATRGPWPDDTTADPDHRRRGRHPGSGADGSRTRLRVARRDRRLGAGRGITSGRRCTRRDPARRDDARCGRAHDPGAPPRRPGNRLDPGRVPHGTGPGGRRRVVDRAGRRRRPGQAIRPRHAGRRPRPGPRVVRVVMTEGAGSASTATESDGPPVPGGTDLLAALWERHRGTNLERVQALEAAAVALLDGDLPDYLRAAASTAAHKLAGALGTFGFDDGTRIARAAEALLEAPSVDPREFSECVVGLLEIVAPTAPTAGAGDDTNDLQGNDGRDSQTGVLLVLTDDAELETRLEVAAAGHQLRFAAPPVDSFERALSDPAVIAVLVDLGLRRGVDLLSTAAAIRLDIPVCALTVNDSYTERLRVVEAGGTGFLARDMHGDEILEVVQRGAWRRSVESAHLVALFDDPAELRQVEAVFERTGFRLSTTTSPSELWEIVENEPPAAVLLDPGLWEVDAVAVLQLIRAEPRFRWVPVVLLGDDSHVGLIGAMFAAGADDFLIGPIDGPELVARVIAHVERYLRTEQLTGVDARTGAANRRTTAQRLVQLLGLAGRRAEPLSLAFVEIDDIDRLRQRHGQATVDAALRAVADSTSQQLRDEDVVGLWSEERLALGLYGAEGEAAVERLAGIIEVVEARPVVGIDGADVALRISAGVAEFPVDGDNLTRLAAAADRAVRSALEIPGTVRGARDFGDDTAGLTRADVVVVDDDEMLADLLIHSLQTAGYSVRHLSDGLEAVELLGSRLLRTRVVVLDVGLPGMDGFSVLRTLRSQGVLETTRVVMLTAAFGCAGNAQRARARRRRRRPQAVQRARADGAARERPGTPVISDSLLVVSVFTLVALGLLCTGAVIAHATVVAARARRLEGPTAHARLVIAASLSSNIPPTEADFEVLRAIPSRQVVTLVSSLTKALRDDDDDTVRDIADELGIVVRACRLCDSRLWWRRLAGARLLTLFDAAAELRPRLLDDRHALVRAQAAEWSAEDATDAEVDALVRLLDDADGLVRHSAKDALIRLGVRSIDGLVAALEGASGRDAIHALEVAASVNDTRVLPSALRLTTDADAETRSLAAVVLGSVGGVDALGRLAQLLDDPDADVRAEAARGLGRLGEWPVGTALAERLGDRSWRVRREAGIALRSIGAPGLLLLRRALGADDPFAVDMAHQALDLRELDDVGAS